MTAKLYYFPDRREFRDKLAELPASKRKVSLDLFNNRRRIFKLWVGTFSEHREDKINRCINKLSMNKESPTIGILIMKSLPLKKLPNT